MASLRGLPAGVLRARPAPAIRWRGAAGPAGQAWYVGPARLGARRSACWPASTRSSRSRPRSGSASPASCSPNITVGLCLFAFISFLEVLRRARSFGITKLVGLPAACSPGSPSISTRDDAEQRLHGRAPDVHLRARAVRRPGRLISLAAGPRASRRGDRHHLPLLPEPAAVPDRLHGDPRARARDVGRVGAGFVAGATIAAVFAILNPPTPGSTTSRAHSGTIGDPNELAAVLVAGVILAGVLIVAAHGAAAGAAAGRAAARSSCSRSGLFFTFSRGGLSRSACALIAALLCGAAAARPGDRSSALLAALLRASCYFASFAGARPRDRITTVRRRHAAAPTSGGSAGAWSRPTRSSASAAGTSRSPRSTTCWAAGRDRARRLLHRHAEGRAQHLPAGARRARVRRARAVPVDHRLRGRCALKAARRFGRAGDRDMESVARGCCSR